MTASPDARCHCMNGDESIGTVPQVQVDPPSWSSRERPIMLDACIAPAVLALWDAGYVTLGSCCGHGDLRWPGGARAERSLVLEQGETDYDGIRKVLAEVDGRPFVLWQWQITEVGTP